MPYVGTPPGGISHGPSIKNPATYEALMRSGKMSKSKAAAISNSALKKGFRKGRHRSKKGRIY